MKRFVLLVIVVATFLALGLVAQETKPDAKDITGDWQGTLKTPQKDLRIVWKVVKEDGRLKTTDYSIDQSGWGFKSSAMTVDGAAVKISFDAVGGEFEGKLAADGSSIAGTWSQGPGSLPLVMVRATKETAWEIPPPPAPVKLMATDADPAFEVATIKPNDSGATSMQALLMQGRNFKTRASSVEDLIAFAYAVQSKQIVGGPEWIRTERFDIAAVPNVEGAPNPEQIRVMIRKLLAERFQLTFHHESRELSAFVLTVAKNGPKLAPTQSPGPLPGLGFSPGKNGVTLRAGNCQMADLTGFLQVLVLDRPVVDQTALTGRFDFKVVFMPDDSQFNGHPPKVPAQTDAAVEAAPNLFDAMQQQLGLRLDAKKTQVGVLAIDKVERPSAN